MVGTGVEHVRAVSVATRDDVDVEVEHALLPRFARAIDEVGAVKAAILDKVFCEFARGRKDGGKVAFGACDQVGGMRLGHDEGMSLKVARDVEERIGLVVLIDLVRRDVALDYLAKNTVFITN